MFGHNPRPQYDLDLLGTDFFPGGDAILTLLAAIGQQENELENVEKEISCFEARLSDLRARRALLAACRDANKGFLAPIRKVPPEILGEIFEHIPQADRNISSSESPLVLLQVCRKWRRTALGMPRLWTALVIGDSSTNDHCRIMEMWLSNSGTLPVDLHLTHKSSMETTPEALQTLFRHLHRFRSIEGFMGTSFIQELSSQGLPLHAPSLQRLAIRDPSWHFGLGNWGGSGLHPRFQRCIHAPRLSDIGLGQATEMVEMLDFHPHHLRRLTFHPPRNTRPTALDLLRTSPNLSFADVAMYGEPGPPSSDQQPVSLTSLHTLKITSYGLGEQGATDIISPFIGSIYAPALETLCVRLPHLDGFPQPFESLNSFLSENAPLHQLSLKGFRPMNSTGFISLISKLSDLRSLHLERCVVEEAVLKALTPEPSSLPSSWLCPRLSALWIQATDVPGEPLVTLLRNRTPTADSNEGLSRIDLFDCEALSCQREAALVEIATRKSIKIDVQRNPARDVINECRNFYEQGVE